MTQDRSPQIGPEPEILSDPVASAKAAGLRYVSDAKPGIQRKRAGKYFSYRGVDGRPIHDPAELTRIKALGIPPAWTDVWICPDRRGHIQATGRDAKGRKQYRYHPRWRAVRDETKYARLLAFGAALPQIRARVAQDLALRGLPRAKVLAATVRLLETTFIRIGNEEYARANDSYGLTTLRNEHVVVAGAELRFHFRGKSGKEHTITVADRRVARIVQRCQDLPGQELFAYLDEHGVPQTIDSEDVNNYLREIAGQEFTAKDFRTWGGTLLAAQELQALPAGDSAAPAKKDVGAAIEAVARRLGNTPAICRKCYVHPAVIESYLDGSLRDLLQPPVAPEPAAAAPALRPEEAGVLHLLQQHDAAPVPARRAG